ncbi:MAG: PilZ domain-containing protein [Candidatus Acidiferrales bacterium]
MEGSNHLRLPRTVIHCPVEIRSGERRIYLEHAEGNLSLGGMFLRVAGLPPKAALHLTISAEHSVEVDGVIRRNDLEGVGIEFVSISQDLRQKICEVIAEFTPREILPV